MIDASKAKKIGIGVLVGALALAGAFSAGRFSAPLQVETKTITVKGETIHEKGETIYIHDQAKIETRVVYRDRVITKDGTITEHEVERAEAKTESKVSAASNTERTATLTESKTEQKTVTLRPSWRVVALVGAQWPKPLLPIAGPLVLGLEVDYRIAGGLSAGLWANTGGAAGLAISFEF